MAERQPTNQLDADDCEDEEYAEFKKQLKIFHEKYKRQIDWLKANGFHEVIDETYMEVEYRNGRKNAKNYLTVLPSFADLGGWRCVAVIDGARDQQVDDDERRQRPQGDGGILGRQAEEKGRRQQEAPRHGKGKGEAEEMT